MFKILKYLFFLFLFVFLVALSAGIGGLYYLIVVNPGPEIELQNIRAILGRESQVFYRDGETKLGVLFEGVHRQYVPYEDIPEYFIDAITASEDDQFFRHFGIDIPGIIRAMIANIRAGRVVQGGSTITQQTAKNLFKREARSYQAKIKEMLYALRLEYKYSKEKILEFYTNQFFVSGNGHGLGVAARYYFNKKPAELSLLECAYIAGSVQRPNYYNPFTRYNRAHPSKARSKVKRRVGYVLGKMFKAQAISRQEYEDALENEVVFNQGKMSFRLNTAMDLVREGLESEKVTTALEDHGIFNVATSGIRIVTSIDKTVQDSTLQALREHLSVLDIRLRGYERGEVQKQYAALDYAGDQSTVPGAFVFGIIGDKVRKNGETIHIPVIIGKQQHQGVIAPDGLEQCLAALAMYRKNRWAAPDAKDRQYLLKQLQPGDRVYVRIMEQTPEEKLKLELMRYPEVQGGVMALQQGMIRVMTGGASNRFFNRATDAKRLLGSTFKPFLFAAAMQLGWAPVDLLNNRRNVFVFMDKPYFPRPDHHSPFDVVSMSWAGVTSENVAAVWLLYHLTDHLTPPRLREMAGEMDMAPRTDGDFPESYQLFKRRVRDDYGIIVNRSSLKKAAFDRAKKALRTDFLFEGKVHEYEELKRLHYGLHFDRYDLELSAQLKNSRLKNSSRQEIYLRKKLLAYSYLSLGSTRRALKAYRRYVSLMAGRSSFFGSRTDAAFAVRPAGNLVQDRKGRLHYTLRSSNLPDDWQIWPLSKVIRHVAALNEQQHSSYWRNICLEGMVTASAYDQLGGQMQREEEKLAGQRPYSMEVLGDIRDYRVMLGLKYLIHLARQCGITSKLQPVLSFPLGSNVITLLEGTRMYETMVTGNRYSFASQAEHQEAEEREEVDGLAIIERIEAPDGEVVYQRQLRATPVFSPQVAAGVGNILCNAIVHGTGKYARKTVRLHSSASEREHELAALDIPVPLLGKTGTANEYRNAAFLGHVPLPEGEKSSFMTLQNGYTLGVYVGYDSNQPMIRRGNRVSGSQGALPVWSSVAAILLESEKAGDQLDLVDLAFNGLNLRYPPLGQAFVAVDPEKGGVPIQRGRVTLQDTPPDFPASLSFGLQDEGGRFEPVRLYLPFWNIKGDPQQTLKITPVIKDDGPGEVIEEKL